MAEKPHAGGSDLLTQALSESSREVDDAFLRAGMTGHPAQEQEEESGEAAPGNGAESRQGADEQPPASQRRYATHEEAERAHAEAERKLQEEAQRRAALEREVELHRQHAALMERQAQERRVEPTLPASEEPAPPATFSPKEHFREAYKRMAQLDPTSEDFETQQQAVFIDALDEAFANLRSSHSLNEQQITERINAAITQALEADKTQARQLTERERLQGKLISHATEHGLDMDPPSQQNPLGGAHYHDVMLAVEQNLYSATATEDEAIAEVVKLVSERRGVTAPTKTGSPPALAGGARPANIPPTTSPQRAQALNTPMERSGMGRTQQTPDDMDAKPISLNEMLERSMRVRRP